MQNIYCLWGQEETRHICLMARVDPQPAPLLSWRTTCYISYVRYRVRLIPLFRAIFQKKRKMSNKEQNQCKPLRTFWKQLNETIYFDSIDSTLHLICPKPDREAFFIFLNLSISLHRARIICNRTEWQADKIANPDAQQARPSQQSPRHKPPVTGLKVTLRARRRSGPSYSQFSNANTQVQKAPDTNWFFLFVCLFFTWPRFHNDIPNGGHRCISCVLGHKERSLRSPATPAASQGTESRGPGGRQWTWSC